MPVGTTKKAGGLEIKLPEKDDLFKSHIPQQPASRTAAFLPQGTINKSTPKGGFTRPQNSFKQLKNNGSGNDIIQKCSPTIR